MGQVNRLYVDECGVDGAIHGAFLAKRGGGGLDGVVWLVVSHWGG